MKLDPETLLQNKFFTIPAALVIAAVGLTSLGLIEMRNDLNACNTGNDDKACKKVLSRGDKTKIDPNVRAAYELKLKNKAEAEAEAKAKAEKAEADREAARKAAEIALARQEKEREEAAAKLKAEFAAEGWWEQQPGIFVRWCDDEHPPCPGPKSNGYSNVSWRAMVYCKERACGDIYARLNIMQDNVVVGWTNDTAYGDIGQKVVLTFGSSVGGSGRIVEFNARG